MNLSRVIDQHQKHFLEVFELLNLGRIVNETEELGSAWVVKSTHFKATGNHFSFFSTSKSSKGIPSSL